MPPMRRVVFTFIASFALIFNLPTALAANPKPGGTCSKFGQVVTYKNVKYNCIIKYKKLVWDSGTKVATKAKVTPTPKVTKKAVPKPTPTVSKSATSTPSSTPTPAPTPSVTPSPTPSQSATPTPTPSPTKSASPTPTPSAVASPTPKPSATSTPAPTPSPTPTPAPTPTPTATTSSTQSSSVDSNTQNAKTTDTSKNSQLVPQIKLIALDNSMCQLEISNFDSSYTWNVEVVDGSAQFSDKDIWIFPASDNVIKVVATITSSKTGVKNGITPYECVFKK